jgi:hypothetical protein
MGAMKRLVFVALAAVVAAGCGGDSDGDGVASVEDVATQPRVSTSSAQVDTEEQLLAFAACMRDQGVDLEDPVVDADGNVQFAPPDDFSTENLDDLRTAALECDEFLEGVALGFENFDLTSLTDTLVEFAACMRENGFDMPDPDLSLVSPDAERIPSAGPFGDIDLSDQDFLDAFEACQDLITDLGVPQD